MKTTTIRNQGSHETALLLLRVMLGTVFAFHGAQKLFGWFGGPGLNGFASYLGSLGIPFPLANAYLAAGTEFIGGLALIAGVFVGFASIPLTITMLVACFALRAGGFDAQKGGFEFPLTLAVMTAAIGLLGAGRFTVTNVGLRTRNEKQSADVSHRQPSLS